MRYGFWGGIDWQMGKMPADFLIGPDGRILKTHYGREIGDHLAVKDVEAILTGLTTLQVNNEGQRAACPASAPALFVGVIFRAVAVRCIRTGTVPNPTGTLAQFASEEGPRGPGHTALFFGEVVKVHLRPSLPSLLCVVSGGRGVDLFTVRFRPWNRVPFKAVMIAWAAWSGTSTKPKPRLL